MSADRPLAGYRVVDLTSVVAGPFATHFLADQGAEVIKIEPPGGDITRRVGPSPQGGMAAAFQHINRGKRSVVLDLKQPDGIAALRRILASVDALVYNVRPRSMARLGLGWDDVKAVNPRLIHCGLMGFGERGRYAGRPAYDDLIQGATGVADLSLRSGGAARYAPMALADRVAGLYLAVALLTALLRRAADGEGRAIEVPMFESMAHFVLVEHMFLKSFSPALGRTGNVRTLSADRRPYETLDGHICVLPYSDRNWRDLFDVLGDAQRRDDPRFADFASRFAHSTELYGALAAALKTRTTAQWLALLEARDIPAMPMNSADQLMDDPHLRDVGFFQLADGGDGGAFMHMASPIEFAGEPRAAPQAAPRLGEHTEAVLRAAGLSELEIDRLIGSGAAAR